MFAVALILSRSVYADCDVANNDPIDMLNYEDCNNAGTCVETGDHTRCECCDPFDPESWCFGYMDNKYSGDTCTTVEYAFAIGFGWRMVTEDGADPHVTCSDMDTDPPAAGGIGFTTSPNLGTQAMAALKTRGYEGITFSPACKTCRADSPCEFSDQGAVTDAVTVGFVTELNTFYDKRCAAYSVTAPKDCAANYDLGASAYEKLSDAFGEQAVGITAAFNAMLDGTHPLCDSRPELCLDWTDTKATVFVEHQFTATTTAVNPTEAPTNPPTDAPTDEPEPVPEAAAAPPACSNMPFSQCGGTYFQGETCCPAGTSCYAIVPMFHQCRTMCVAGWSCNN